MNTEVGRNLLWNETKVCSLRGREGGRKRESERKRVRQPPGPGLFVGGHFYSVTLRAIGVYAMIRLRDVSHAVSGGLLREIWFFFFLSFAVRLLAVRAAKCFISRPWLVDKETARPKRRDPWRFIYAALCGRRPHSSGRLRTGAGYRSIAPQLLPPPSHRRRRRKVGHLFFARNWLSWVSRGFAVIISSRYSRAQHGGSSIPNPPPSIR